MNHATGEGAKTGVEGSWPTSDGGFDDMFDVSGIDNIPASATETRQKANPLNSWHSQKRNRRNDALGSVMTNWQTH